MRAIAIGAFDGVHLGHKEVIEKAIQFGRTHNLKTTILTFSPHPEIFFKGEEFKLLTTEEEREELLLSLGVDEIIKLPFNEELANMPPESFFKDILISKLNVKFISVGFNFTFGKEGKGTPALLKKLSNESKITVEIIPPKAVMGRIVSSTKIRELIKDGKIEEAAILLGRNYSIKGLISRGNGIGRKIGFPTINISVNPEKLLPPDGVYATIVNLDNKNFLGAMNIGKRPTIYDKGERRVEVYILDYEGDVYGKTVRIEITNRIRGEKKFSSLNELREQIERDINWIRKHCKIG